MKASGPIEVPAIGDHPAGIGVLVEYTFTWPDDTGITRRALRLIQQNGQWRVDQAEDIADSDQAHGDPVRTALARG